MSLHNNDGLISKGSKDIVSKSTENSCCQQPRPSPRNPREYLQFRIDHILPQLESPTYNLATDSIGLSSFKF